MDKVLESLVEWLKEILVGGIVNNLSGMFDSVNSRRRGTAQSTA